MYVSGGEGRIRPSFYPENEGSLSEGILIEFDFLDPTQGLVLQIMHQDPNQEFAVQGKMKNSHQNKISELRIEDEDLKGNAVTSAIGMFSVPLILLLGMFFIVLLGSISMFLLGHLFSFMGFISKEDLALIMNGSDSKVPQEGTLIAVSMMISIFLTGFLVSKASDFFSRKTREILKASLNVESELLEVFQDSNWSLNGRDILR